MNGHPSTGTVVVLTGDPVGERMAGPAIRAVELARALTGAGVSALVVAPELRAPGPGDVAVVAAPGEGELATMCAGALAVVAFSAVAAENPWLFDLGVPVVVDAYDPGLLETLERFRGTPFNEQRDWVTDATRHLVDPLRRADLVLVASERQRHLVLGLLTAVGRVNPRTWAEDPSLRRLCAVVPFGVAAGAPPEAPADGPLRRGGPLVAEDAVVALWGGGLYDWLDPMLLVDAIACSRDPRLTGVFLAGPHPTPAVGRLPLVARVRERAAELGLLGTRVVLVEEWIPYAERGRWFGAADIGVSLHTDHVETTFSFRTRILDYLWARLPVVCSAGDHFAELVERDDLGEVVPIGDAEALAEALDRVASQPSEATAARRRRLDGVAESNRWSSVVAPLVEWLHDPRLAADRRSEPGG